MFVGSRWVVGAFLLAVLVGCDRGNERAPAGGTAMAAAAAPAPDLLSQNSDPLDLTGIAQDEGDALNAPVVVIEFSDFGCVFCARFHAGDYHTLRNEFVTSGDVVWRYIPVTIGGFPNSDVAASAALCIADQTDFAPIRDRLYEDRDIWLRQSGPEAREQFRGYAQAQSVDMAQWETCVDDPATRQRLDMANRAAAAAGVRGTPSFLVQGFLVQGAPVLENFQMALRQLIADVRAGDP